MSWWPKRFIWLNSRRRLGVGAVFGVSFSTMAQWREILKRSMPSAMRKALIATRKKLAAPPLEDIVLHDYELVPDPDGRPRLSLIIPTFAPEMAFGGVTTGIDIFLEIGRRAGVSLRVVVDDFGAAGMGLLEGSLRRGCGDASAQQSSGRQEEQSCFGEGHGRSPVG